MTSPVGGIDTMDESSGSGSGSEEAPEAIVIGTGFGGAVAACRLRQAGFRTLVLERGRRYEASDFPALPESPRLMPDGFRWSFHTSQGLWDIQDLGELVSVQAAGFGGGSLVYANVHLRPPKDVFDWHWPEAFQGRTRLEPFFDLAAYMLDVSPITSSPELRNVVKAKQLLRVTRQLGREQGFFHPPLAVNYQARENPHGVWQEGCVGCGACSSGCRHGAKNTLDVNYLALAERHGARVRTQCEVIGLTEIDTGFRVDCIDHLRGETRQFEAKFVFLCAGAVHTTRLLNEARLKRGEPPKALGLGYFPNADAIGVVYDTEHPQYPSWGPTITTATVHSKEETQAGTAEWFMIQDGGYAVELERLMGLLRARGLVGRNRLTSAGKAEVDAETGEPPAAPVPGLPASQRLPSPLDALLDALEAGSFRDAVPRQLIASTPAFLEELGRSLLLPELVNRTVERSIRIRLEKFFLTRWFRKTRLFPLLVRCLQRCVYRGFLEPEELARQAIGSVAELGNLPKSEVLRRLFGYDETRAAHRMMLLAMGRDPSSGALIYDPSARRLQADLELYGAGLLYGREELAMKDIAKVLGGELRVNPIWSTLGKPITVHSQGGCRLSDDSEPELGALRPDGEVRCVPGLYVFDGAALPTSVGVNPSATILALAEHNVLAFIRRHRGQTWPLGDASAGASEYSEQRTLAEAWATRAREKGWMLEPPECPAVAPRSQPIGLQFKEQMQGYFTPGDVDPKMNDARYRALEITGRPAYPIAVELCARVENLAAFFEDPQHRLHLSGSLRLCLPGAPDAVEECAVESGFLDLLVPREKPFGLDAERCELQSQITGRKHTASSSKTQPRFMHYGIWFRDAHGRSYLLKGYKRMRDDPGFDAWRDTTTLFIRLFRLAEAHSVAPKANPADAELVAAGAIHVDLNGFLYHQMPSFEVTGTDDPTRINWALGAFSSFFFLGLQQIYRGPSDGLGDIWKRIARG